MPHPTSDHVVGQWMNNRQDMILAMPLIATKPTLSLHRSAGYSLSYQRLPAKLVSKLWLSIAFIRRYIRGVRTSWMGVFGDSGREDVPSCGAAGLPSVCRG